MKPNEVQTNETLQFVLRNIPAQKFRILEVGCGSGALAKQLHDLGHEVVAIDSSAESIAASKELGVDARVASFPAFDEAPFDVILFTRSLHHIRPLSSAVTQAHRLIKSSGSLLVEDFAFTETNVHTTTWFYRLLKLLEACNVLLPAEESFGRKLLKGGGGMSLWQDHVHEINTALQVSQAISERFEILQAESAPYLYRYVSELVEDSEQGRQIVSRVLDLEKEAGQEGFLIGRRFVGKPGI